MQYCASSLDLNVHESSDMTEEIDINRFDSAIESLHEQVKTKQEGCSIDSPS